MFKGDLIPSPVSTEMRGTAAEPAGGVPTLPVGLSLPEDTVVPTKTQPVSQIKTPSEQNQLGPESSILLPTEKNEFAVNSSVWI